MVSEGDFSSSEFFKSFFKYIENGKLPKGFKSKQELWTYIKTVLTSQQRYSLVSQYDYQFKSRSSHEYGPALSPDLEPANQVIPRAIAEGMVCSAIIGCATYAYTSDLYTAFKSTGVGLFWIFGRILENLRIQSERIESLRLQKILSKRMI